MILQLAPACAGLTDKARRVATAIIARVSFRIRPLEGAERPKKPYPRLRKIRASICNLLSFQQFDYNRQANLHDNRKESRQPAMCAASQFAGIVAIPSPARRGKQT